MADGRDTSHTRKEVSDMNYNSLTDEQKAKARAAKTPEDIMALAKEEGYELTEAELETVSGGWCLAHCDPGYQYAPRRP
jgi:hypothetical protein